MAGTHEITTYSIRYWSAKGTMNWAGFVFKSHGWIMCRGSGTVDRLLITIAPDDEPLHAGKTVTQPSGSGTADTGFIAIRRANLGVFIDLLRNEKPIYMLINAPPLDVFNEIFTGPEPVGEGETRTS
jgi:hypothetical protein